MEMDRFGKKRMNRGVSRNRTSKHGNLNLTDLFDRPAEQSYQQPYCKACSNPAIHSTNSSTAFKNNGISI